MSQLASFSPATSIITFGSSMFRKGRLAKNILPAFIHEYLHFANYMLCPFYWEKIYLTLTSCDEVRANLTKQHSPHSIRSGMSIISQQFRRTNIRLGGGFRSLTNPHINTITAARISTAIPGVPNDCRAICTLATNFGAYEFGEESLTEFISYFFQKHSEEGQHKRFTWHTQKLSDFPYGTPLYIWRYLRSQPISEIGVAIIAYWSLHSKNPGFFFCQSVKRIPSKILTDESAIMKWMAIRVASDSCCMRYRDYLLTEFGKLSALAQSNQFLQAIMPIFDKIQFLAISQNSYPFYFRTLHRKRRNLRVNTNRMQSYMSWHCPPPPMIDKKTYLSKGYVTLSTINGWDMAIHLFSSLSFWSETFSANQPKQCPRAYECTHWTRSNTCNTPWIRIGVPPNICEIEAAASWCGITGTNVIP